MKRIYMSLSAILLAILMLVGLVSIFDQDETYSESERRALKTAPRITFSGLLDGSYFSDFEDYYADTFPGRESLMADNSALNGFYYFGGLTDGDGASLILDFSSNGANQGEALQAEGETLGEADDEDQKTADPVTEKLGSVLLMGDRAFDVPYATNERIIRYAGAVNAIADTLGDEVRTFWMPVPNSAEFYTEEQYHTGVNSQYDMFQLGRENLTDRVTYVDAYTVLAGHTEEYLYFRTDHHWTHLGAYYAYTALCEAAGFEPESLDRFETGQWDDFVGSMYTYAANYPQAKVLKENPDTVHYWKPYVACTSTYYSDTSMSDPVSTGTICRIGENVTNKYLTFMGGDHPVTIVETEAEGPCILVIKESYGNALISWLTSHYSRIILIDPREYFAGNEDIDLADFARDQGVDQCLIVNYPMMLNSEGYITHLENLTK